MILNKEDIVLSLQEKVNGKLESMRQDLAESIFTQMSDENFFVFNKTESDVVGGPFGSKTAAAKFVAESEDASDLVILSEKQADKILSK
jgi:hypothetical protein